MIVFIQYQKNQQNIIKKINNPKSIKCFASLFQIETHFRNEPHQNCRLIKKN